MDFLPLIGAAKTCTKVQEVNQPETVAFGRPQKKPQTGSAAFLISGILCRYVRSCDGNAFSI